MGRGQAASIFVTLCLSFDPGRVGAKCPSAIPTYAGWIAIHFLMRSTAFAACGMSNLESEPLPDDLISYVQENRINLDMYVIERVVKRGKLVIYLLDKNLPQGYRGSRPGVRQYEFIFDRATKKMLGVSMMR